VIALAIIALTIGGWIYVLMIPIDRFALSAQTRLWWIEQVVSFVLAIVCVGIIIRKRSFLHSSVLADDLLPGLRRDALDIRVQGGTAEDSGRAHPLRAVHLAAPAGPAHGSRRQQALAV